MFLAFLCAAVGTLPAPTGNYPIGTRVRHLTDGSRQDPVKPRMHREIMVQFWYPTNHRKGEKESYLPDPRFGEVLIQQQYYLQDKALLTSWKHLKTHAFKNAQPDHAQLWPILLLEPGLGMPRENYTAFCEDLASHGYFVAAIDPPRGGLTLLPDGQVLSAGDDAANNDPNKLDGKVAEWAGDMSFVLSTLSAESKKWSIDVKKVGALGHSMGGSAALQAAQSDSRVVAALDMDGTGGVTGLDQGAKKPMVFLKSNPNYSDADLAKLHRTRAQWEAMGKNGPKMFEPLSPAIKSEPVYQFAIRDTGHLSYSDAPFLFPNTITRFSDHPLPAERTLRVTMEITRGFFDHYLKGQAWNVPDQSQMPWPEVQFKRLY